MKFTTIVPALGLFMLCACGGASSSDQLEVGMDPPDLGDPIFAISSPSAEQLDGVYSFERGTAVDFDVANRSSLITPSGGVATFDGHFQVSVGDQEEYLSGDLDLQFNLINGSGNGTVDQLNISGNDVDNRLISTFASLDVLIPNLDGAVFDGTISGQYSDRAQNQNDVSATYTVNTTVDGRFVEGRLSDNILGVVEGTISDPDRGTVPVFGVIVADRDILE